MDDREETGYTKYSDVVQTLKSYSLNQIVFFVFPLLWLALVAGLLLFDIPLHKRATLKDLFFVANLFFFGFTHVGATYYFLISDSVGKAWWKSLESRRRSQLIGMWILGLLVCIVFFYGNTRQGVDNSRYLHYFNLWTAWHAFRQSESLFFTIDQDHRNQQLLKIFRALFFIYALFLVTLGKYKTPEIVQTVSIASVLLVSMIVFRCFQHRKYKSMVFSVRFYFWSLQWMFPVMGIATFAIHGVEYLCINDNFLNLRKFKFLLYMLLMSGLFVLFVHRDKFYFSYLILVLYYFANMAHYIVDRYIFQYRFEFERTNILEKLKL